jgi:hypothetical protein
MHTVSYTTRPTGGRRLAQAIGALLIAAVLLGQCLTARANHEEESGLRSETQYVSVQFLYELEWDAPWFADEVFIGSEAGEYDRLFVYGDFGAKVHVVHTFGNDLDEELEAAMESTATDLGYEVVESDEGVDELGLPYVSATIAFDSNDPDDFEGELIPWIAYIEVGVAFTNDLDEGIRVLILEAPAEVVNQTYRDVQDTFVANRGMTGPFFVGQPPSEAADERGRAGDDERDSADDGDRDAPSSRNDEDTSAAEAEYLAELERQVDVLADSIERFTALINDPDFGDEASIAEVEEILVTWTVAPFEAYMLTPPAGYEEANAAFVRFTEHLYAAAEAIFDGDETEFVANLEQAQEQLTIVFALLDDLTGESVLDRPSGKVGSR